ncbi:MAG: hypothetical protein MUO54_13350 [Anaerolineales bacterium]|nr:hypothetical protein [Anaerolineales bacterium]
MSRWIKSLSLITALLICSSCFSPTVISLSSPEEEPRADESSPATKEAIEPEPTATQEVLDCGLDLECFIGRIGTCQKSTFTFAQTMDFMGANIFNSLLIQVVGDEEEQCVFKLKTDKILVTISDEVIAQLLESGISEEDIETQRLAIEQSQEDSRYDETCQGNPDDLGAMLLRWKNGEYALSDWDPFACEGKIFSALEQVTLPTATEEIPQATAAQPPPGGNLLANMSFENNPESANPRWEIQTKNTNVEAQWTIDQSNLGEYSLLVSATETANQGFPGWFTVESISIDKGEWHIFQVWAMTPDGADAFISAEFIDESGTYFSGQSSGCVDLESNVWKAVSFGILAETTEDVHSMRLGLQQCLTNTTGTKTHLYYDDIYLGTTPP